jgi:hypothetical protein
MPLPESWDTHYRPLSIQKERNMNGDQFQVGLDISQKRLDVCTMRANGEVLLYHRSFANNRHGYEALKRLDELMVWFGWSSTQTAMRYVTAVEIKKRYRG